MTAALIAAGVILLAVVAHELGHAAAAQALRLPWHPVVDRRGVGISIGSAELELTRQQVAATAIAGPAASIAFAVACWHVSPIAALVSADLALWNLILPRSDGALILRALRGRPYTYTTRRSPK